MIRQLMRRDPALLWLAPTALCFGIGVALWHFFGDHGRISGRMVLDLIFLIPLPAVVNIAVTRESEASFLATLPITVRQVFAARMLSMLALLWIPVVTGALVMAAYKDPGIADMPLWNWFVVTCCVVALESTSIRGVETGAKTPLEAWPVLLASAIIGTQNWSWMISFVGCVAVVGCWLTTAALVRTWPLAPASVQIMLEEMPAANPKAKIAHRVGKRGRPWGPIFAHTYPAMGANYYIFIFALMCVMYSPMFIYMLSLSGAEWMTIRPRLRWLCSLPIPRRTILAANLLPGVLSLSGGYLVSAHLPFTWRHGNNHGIRTQIVTVAFIGAWLGLMNLIALIGDYYPVRRVLPSAHSGAMFSFLGKGAGMALWILQSFANVDPVAWFSSRLPGSLTGAIAVIIVLLSAIYGAIDRIFRGVEYVDRPAAGELK